MGRGTIKPEDKAVNEEKSDQLFVAASFSEVLYIIVGLHPLVG